MNTVVIAYACSPYMRNSGEYNVAIREENKKKSSHFTFADIFQYVLVACRSRTQIKLNIYQIVNKQNKNK